MRVFGLLVACGLASAQISDPAYEPLARSYTALTARDYDTAIAGFLQALAAAPGRASIHKDLAYTYLKVGEPELARDEFGAALRFEPQDTHTALEFDPGNVELRRELGFLLLRMGLQADAEQVFEILTESPPGDLLSAAQLGFLFYARGDREDAMPLLNRVLAGGDEELANRVRAVLRVEQVLEPRPEAKPVIDAKEMAERSIKAGYLKDAVKYLQMAHEAEPGNSAVMLKLGWAYNLLHQDVAAYSWFDRARHGADPMVAAEAARAWHNLHGAMERFRTSGWVFPTFSTRWHDLFSYGQVKTEVRTGLPIRPYLTVRFIGDTRVQLPGVTPEYLSESSFIIGAGLATSTWRGLMAWAEAGSAASYVTGHMLPDYRGGVSFSRTFGAALAGDSSGFFLSSNTDGVYISRFANDLLAYQQTRLGWTGEWKRLRAQIYWNANVTVDAHRQGWANFIELGPGIRFRPPHAPSPFFVTADLVRGAYLIHGSFPQSTFSDVRVGVWYAFSL